MSAFISVVISLSVYFLFSFFPSASLHNPILLSERLNPPPPKPEKQIRSASRESPNKLYSEGARGKRASLAPRPKQNQLAPPMTSSNRSLSPGRRGSRIRSQSVQLAQAPLGSSVNASRKAR